MLIFILIITFLGYAPPTLAQAVTVKGLVSIVKGEGASENRSDNGNAVVWLQIADRASGRPSASDAPQPRNKFSVVQHKKRFDPHVLAVPVGSIVDFPNRDPFFHNVFSLFDGKRFDLGLYEAGTSHSVTFDRPGVCFIFCNIHPEMSAVIVVLDTPYHAISNGAGEFSISNVPPGRYLLSVWHERCPESLKGVPREVIVSASNASLGTIRLTESRDLLFPHKNKYGYDYTSPNPPNGLYDGR